MQTDRLKTLLARIDGTLFGWVRWIYPGLPGYPGYLLATYLGPQKLLRINGRSPWPVHFTSTVLYPEKIELGCNTAPGLAPRSYIQARNGIVLGANLRMGPGVGLISANHDFDDYDRWVPGEPIRIGDDVWIGMNTVLMPGIVIGNNVAIGASSTVTKNIPANSVAVGSPCRVIRTKAPYRGRRFDCGPK
jgi:acetyltransferase-like isoleucine patch superfamily enzyme